MLGNKEVTVYSLLWVRKSRNNSVPVFRHYSPHLVWISAFKSFIPNPINVSTMLFLPAVQALQYLSLKCYNGTRPCIFLLLRSWHVLKPQHVEKHDPVLLFNVWSQFYIKIDEGKRKQRFFFHIRSLQTPPSSSYWASFQQVLLRCFNRRESFQSLTFW
jgi:hypothetical protein